MLRSKFQCIIKFQTKSIMKKLLLFSAFIVSFLSFSQVPQGISYQAIALNSSGNPVASSNIRVKLSILDQTANGTVLYSETQQKTTTAQGLFNLIIGQGTVVSGTFNTINWGTNSKFLKVEMDVTGGTNYANVGTTQLLSVPYALMAGGISGSSANESIENNQFSNFAFADNSNGVVYAFNLNTNTWIPVNAYADDTLVGSNGNFAFSDNSNGKVYAFNNNSGTWILQNNAFAGNTLVTSNGNFAFADNGNGKVYAFNKNTGTWVLQNGFADDTLVSSSGNFAFADNSNGKVYAYNKNTGTWSFVNGFAGTSLITSNGSFAFADNSNGKVYVYNKNTGTWILQNAFADTTLIAAPSNK